MPGLPIADPFGKLFTSLAGLLSVPCRGWLRYLPGPGRGIGRGDDPPRPSSMPIDVEGVLIWSGGRGLGAIALVYRQGSQPRERLYDHEHA
jgi:hypothetical protein